MNYKIFHRGFSSIFLNFLWLSIFELATLHTEACTAKFYYHASGNTVYFQDSSITPNMHSTIWDFGDGTSSANGYAHTYVHSGKYKVCLYITDTLTRCVDSYCDSVSTNYSIIGTITPDSTSFDYKLWLIQFDPSDSSLKAIQQTFIYSFALTYHFDGLMPGTYYVKAAAYDSSSHSYDSSYIPTYYDTATKWANAQPITITNDVVTGANIVMVAGNYSGGPGFIGGKISQGANKKAVGDPISNVEVMLYKNGKPVTYTFSNANGAYQFKNLAYGTYEVYPEVPGIKTYSIQVTISEQIKSVSTVDIKINSKSAVVALNMEEDKRPLDLTELYPNPVEKELNLEFNSINCELAQLTVFDITGKTIYSQVHYLNSGQQTIKLNAANLTPGIYSIRLQTLSHVWQSRFMKE